MALGVRIELWDPVFDSFIFMISVEQQWALT
jgi:hypothetical protein